MMNKMGSKHEFLGITWHILSEYSKYNLTYEEIKGIIADPNTEQLDEDIDEAIDAVYSGHGMSDEECVKWRGDIRDEVRLCILKYLDLELEELRQLLIASCRK